MDKKTAKKLHNKQERAKKDVNKSLPVAILPFGDFILLLAASKDYRRRIKRALDRVVTVSFGSEGYDLQRLASAEARGQVFSEVSYENVTATSVAERISTQLRHHLKRPNLPQIDGALILVRLDMFHPGGDEVVVVSYDGSLSFVDYFFSGVTSSKEASEECSCEMGCAGGTGKESEDPAEQVSDKPKKSDEDDEDEDVGMGKALPAFEEYVSQTGPDNRVSVFDVIERFGIECERMFGKDIFVQAVQMSRSAAKTKKFDEVFQVMHGPWGELKKEIRKIKKESEKDT